MSDKEKYIKEWLVFADEDYFLAGDLIKNDNKYPRSICFHCQQAAEKYLKAYIIHLDLAMIKTHSLSIITQQLKQVDVTIERLEETAASLSEYAVTVRYPDDFEKISEEEAVKAFEQTTEIKKFIALKLNL